VASFAIPKTPGLQYITLSDAGNDYGYVGDTVTVSGTGFSGDTSCSLSGSIITSMSPCFVAGGSLLPPPTFKVGKVAPGVYTVTAIGSPMGDIGTAAFQVLASSPPELPNSTLVSVDIYIPPDFTGLSIGSTWTSFTNSYDPHIIQLSKQSASDQIGPNWWKITVSGITVTQTPSAYSIPLVSQRVFVYNQTQYVRLFEVTSPSTAGRYFFKAFINGASIGSQNFPTLVVKGSRDPAYISGVLRDSGERNAPVAGHPIQLPNGTGAQVVATGIDYLGRAASAQAFINSTADGNYTLFGVAPGTYNITAYAAGYIPTTKPTTVNVGPAQSLETVDIYLTRGVNITGTVLSEDGRGSLIQWGTLSGFSGATPRPITIRLANLDGSVAASTSAPYGFVASDLTNPTLHYFNFAIHDQFGWDGRIPQNFANYTSGLGFGDYLLYAYVTSYIQLEEVRVHVANATSQTISVIPLIRSGSFNVTVHFKDLNSTIAEAPIGQTAVLTVSAYDQNGVLRAQNTTFITNPNARNAIVELQGLSSSRGFGIASLLPQNYGILPGTYQIIARVTSSPSFAGFANVGIRDLYYQTDNVEATLGLGQGELALSFSVYRAGELNVTIFSIDDQTPSVYRNWTYPGKAIYFLIISSTGLVYQANGTQPSGSSSVNFVYVGLQTDNYEVVIQTLGYTQREILRLSVLLGGTADGSIRMIQNPVIDLTVPFKDEGLLSTINSTQPYAQPINHLDGTPARVEVFDDLGNFVAANVSYVPNLDNKTGKPTPTYIAHFVLTGFDQYYGDPRFVWSGFYDTTDAARQPSGGLILYPWSDSPRWYVVRIWVDGYYQTNQLQVLVAPRGKVSAIDGLDRATRISGSIAGPDFYDVARPLSWAAITLEPYNYTLTGLLDVRPGNYTTFSLDGSFQVWVPGGSYGMGASLAGYSSYSTLLQVPWGSDINMQFYLNDYQPAPVTSSLLSSWLILPNLPLSKHDYNATHGC
jgi:hypothetical protein